MESHGLACYSRRMARTTMVEITGLNIHPVKSCRGIAVREALLTSVT